MSAQGHQEIWCQPSDQPKRQFIVLFDDPQMGIAVFDDETEAREYWQKATIDWSCYLLGTLARAPVAPVAWRVLAEPNLPVSFARTKADADQIAHNLLTYRKGCTAARVEPLYASPAPAVEPVGIKALREADDAPERLWLSAADTDNEHDVWFDADEGGTEYVRADLASAGYPAVKALKWRDLSYKALDMVASHPFGGEYHITEEGEHQWPFVVRPFLTPQSNYQTLGEAKTACEADYERRVRSALHTTPTPVSAPVGVVDLIKCAEILAGLEENRCRSFPTEQDCEFARTTLASLRSPAVEAK